MRAPYQIPLDEAEFLAELVFGHLPIQLRYLTDPRIKLAVGSVKAAAISCATTTQNAWC